MEEVLYERLNPSEFQERLKKAPIAYLPLGTLEWHSTHLPLGSDSLQSQDFFRKLAQRVGGIVLPPLFLGPDNAQEISGYEYYGMDIYGYTQKHPQQLTGSAYWIPEKLFSAILEALLKQLHRAGFKIVVAHGHGPSTDHIIRNSAKLSRKFELAILTVWRTKDKRKPDMEFQYDHAAANETSIMMTLHPDLVHMENLPKNPKKKPLAIMGKDPRKHASAKHGERIIQLNLDRMEKKLKTQLLHLQKTSQAAITFTRIQVGICIHLHWQLFCSNPKPQLQHISALHRQRHRGSSISHGRTSRRSNRKITTTCTKPRISKMLRVLANTPEYQLDELNVRN